MIAELPNGRVIKPPSEFKKEVFVMSSIMIVDDSMFMRKVIKGMVQKLGHSVMCEAADGREAVENYKKFRPDVVTMDITMPSMNGLTALKEILAFDPKAKIILCSAMHSQSLVIQGIKDGALDFVEKPLLPGKLKEAIAHASYLNNAYYSHGIGRLFSRGPKTMTTV
jgi:two-component system chemotaxis response regulator CheY